MESIFFEDNIRDEMGFPVEVLVQDNSDHSVNVTPHWHTCFELLYFLDGMAVQTINGFSIPAQKGDIVFLRSGDIHSIRCDDAVPTRIFVLKFMPSLVDRRYTVASQPRHLIGFLNRQLDTPVCSLEACCQEKIRNYLIRIESEYRSQDRGYELYIRGYILELLGFLVRNGVVVTLPELFEPELFQQMNEIIAYMEENFSQEITLQDIARISNMNYSYMSRYFKKLTGRNFKQYLDYIRVSEASQLLLESDRTLTDIAAACGFSCPQAMTRTYSRLRGFPPSALRR